MTEVEYDENELILPVHPILQSKKWDCGPTALRIAMRYQFGLKLTPLEMITICGTTPEDGTSDAQLKNGLQLLGFKYRESIRGSWSKIKSTLQDGQVPIVHLVMKDGGGHYMVVSGYDEYNSHVYLADPASGKTLKYGIQYFLGVWKEEEDETNTRWYLVITGHVGDKLSSLIKRFKRIQKKVKLSRS